jgi:hypothetical protein
MMARIKPGLHSETPAAEPAAGQLSNEVLHDGTQPLPDITAEGEKARREAAEGGIRAGDPQASLPAALAEAEPAGSVLTPTGYRVIFAGYRLWKHGDVLPAASLEADEIGRLMDMGAITPHFGPLPDRAIVVQ